MPDLYILIIDDDPIYHLMITRILNKLGFPNSKGILDPLEGLEFLLLTNRLPDVLFLDINMPGINGWELLDELETSARSFAEMDIYIVTSSIDKYDTDKSSKYKIAGYLNKPVKSEVFKDLLVKKN
ncbi:response regulator [Leeuwenhoekiella sp. H156]|uniref:response regulator n=1 Tax=Leeuwenhoekiella sp. H156 TaxID=3450128 RepID=UPI003FA44B1A